MSVASIIGQAGSTTTQGTSRYEDKEMFLKLLVAQLNNQDPLNPVEDKEFIAQLAQFTQVEELQKVNNGIGQMVEAYDKQQLVSGAMLLGMRVLSSGYTISKGTYEGEPVATPIYYTADEELGTSTLTILNPNTGQIVYSENLGAKLAGDYIYTWNGKNGAGQAVPDGVYEVSINATNIDGRRSLVSTQVYGDVVLVEKTDGEFRLRFSDNRTVKLVDVNTVGYVPRSGNSGDTDESANTGGNADGSGSIESDG